MLEDHDRFLLKNKSLAEGYQLAKLQNKIEENLGGTLDKSKESSCFNCRKKNKCLEFKSKSSSGSAGAVSIGADTVFICAKYEPFLQSKENKGVSQKQISNMLKLAKKGRL